MCVPSVCSMYTAILVVGMTQKYVWYAYIFIIYLYGIEGIFI